MQHMESWQVIEQRRSVRSYRSAPIDRGLIERLIKTAVMAPSAMNAQPWAFAVVTGAERIEALGRRARAFLTAHIEDHGLPENIRTLLADLQFRIFYGAPALIIVLATSQQRQAREDACLAAQTLMLDARECQLGTCWIGLACSWLAA
jgi:nitroreductase